MYVEKKVGGDLVAVYFECSENKEKKKYLLMKRINEWIYSDAMYKILSSFNTCIPNDLSTEESVDWLLRFSDKWDYRKKQQSAIDEVTNEAARWLLNDSEILEQQARAVMEGIEELGLVGVDTPRYEEYDYIVALGGAKLSCLLRPRYAKEVWKQFSIKPRAIMMLSGARPIAESERSVTDTYAKGAKTEFDLICKGAELCFGITEFEEERHCDNNINLSWAVRTYNNTCPVIAIEGPSTEPDKRRANSADTYKFFVEKYHVFEGAKILLVTSQIYVPYQQLEAIRTLSIPYNLVTDTIGFPNSWFGQVQGMQQPSNYLQEIRSTIQAMSRLLPII